jgi:hypothetical protein
VVLWMPPLHGQQLLDRVVARVSGVAITQSDVDAALALGVVEAEPGQDPFASGARQLVDRQLLLAEVARCPPPEPSAAQIAEGVARMRARAGASFADVVKRTGVDDERVRLLARDTLRIQAYVDQRFGTTAQVGTQEARDYYDAHRQEFTRNGVLAPFEEVEAAARQAAAAERRRRTIAQWIADLRTRGDIVIVTPTR